ncbi:MAG: TetR/AcrR family transcriptional regulator [Rhizonema sp. PD38]|nr:TetR/AcrR family transcriptional regulator [Rhizonema sp. PD38]
MLAEKGLAKVTSEAIAERAGVSKATIYRWWPNKSAVLMDGFLLNTAPKIPFQHSQPGFESIRQQMKKVAQLYSGKTGTTIATLIAQGQIDQELAQEFRNRYILPRRMEARIALEAAIQLGELDPQINIETTIDALYGPLFYRLLVGHGPIDEEFVDSLAAYVLDGICKKSKSEDT